MPNYAQPHMSAIIFGGVALLLVACQHDAQFDGKMPSHKVNACGANRLSDFVGMQASASTLDAMHRRLGIDPNREEIGPGDRQFRWIKPGEEILADYNPWRINISVSEDEKILGIGCY